jgi:ribosomal protein S18 acetylase RimI-like enzyme
MPIAIRDTNVERTPLSPLPALKVRRTSDVQLMAKLQQRPIEDMARRFADGHRAYVAWYDKQPAAFGWVATRVADIGELKAQITLPQAQRYLWNFVTLPEFRGLGIYPRLLDEIVRLESNVDRFWIAFAPENRASGSGIAKAGFTLVAELSFDDSGRAAFFTERDEYSADVAGFVGLPLAGAALTPCWKCVRAGRSAMSCEEGKCRCDYQRPDVACAT